MDKIKGVFSGAKNEDTSMGAGDAGMPPVEPASPMGEPTTSDVPEVPVSEPMATPTPAEPASPMGEPVAAPEPEPMASPTPAEPEAPAVTPETPQPQPSDVGGQAVEGGEEKPVEGGGMAL